jgi:hypothetical protein
MKSLLIFGCVLCSGLGMGYGAYSMALSTQNLLDTGIQVPAKVTKLVESVSRDSNGKTSRVYYPVFIYEVDGKTYEEQSNSGSNPPSYRVGESTQLTIDPENPSEFLPEDFFSRWGGSLILGIFSFILSLIGSIGTFFMFRKAKNKKWLASNGLTITAKVIEVGLNTSLKINGRSPYRITAQWLNPRTNVVQLFHSENIWYDPSSFVTEQIDVKIDPQNDNVYHMILDKIPKAA